MTRKSINYVLTRTIQNKYEIIRLYCNNLLGLYLLLHKVHNLLPSLSSIAVNILNMLCRI